MAKTYVYTRTQICYADPAREFGPFFGNPEVIRRTAGRAGALPVRAAPEPITAQRVKVAQMRKTPGGSFEHLSIPRQKTTGLRQQPEPCSSTL